MTRMNPATGRWRGAFVISLPAQRGLRRSLACLRPNVARSALTPARTSPAMAESLRRPVLRSRRKRPPSLLSAFVGRRPLGAIERSALFDSLPD